ncbi:hypothetical protein KAURM247S_02329 [Kitasatospora aureofaciens]|uniref:hypothetical protein n=1 Tax=Streptomyces griseoflavus TaxID=35619 RepID=UPI00167EA993|nr:hypothetical protein [Streptomyces griseoflavus]GGV36873.1 hypothetical protein GCM10010293_40400 [Streptomyces griseoflavus]
MGSFSRKVSEAATEAADTVASAAIRAGRKVAGERGADAANALTGRRYARCPEGCINRDPNHSH